MALGKKEQALHDALGDVLVEGGLLDLPNWEAHHGAACSEAMAQHATRRR